MSILYIVGHKFEEDLAWQEVCKHFIQTRKDLPHSSQLWPSKALEIGTIGTGTCFYIFWVLSGDYTGGEVPGM
jgi:hypothetical protein